MPKTFSGIEPLAVRTADAMRMAGHGKTKLFALLKAGEYESFLDGRIRLITTASIRARIARKLEENRRIEARP
jgi:hypothetical protein